MRSLLRHPDQDLSSPPLIRPVLCCAALALIFSSGFFSQASHHRQPPNGVKGLVELYGITSVTILRGDEDEFAAEILKNAVLPLFKTVKVFRAGDRKPGKDPLVMYVGSFRSNVPASLVFKDSGFSIKWDTLSEGSYLLMTRRKAGSTVIFVTGRDRLGTIYAANDLKNYYIRAGPGRVLLNELNLVEQARLKYRWVSLTGPLFQSKVRNQEISEPDANTQREKAAGNALESFGLLVDRLSAARVNGLLVRGLLEMAGGNNGAVAEFCRLSMEKGVPTIPVVTVGGGEGFVSVPGHQFNLISRSQTHPELRAIGVDGKAMDRTLCPSRLENQKWYKEGVSWWHANFKVGGLLLDTSPLLLCYCADCRNARLGMKGTDSDYYREVARMVGMVGSGAQDSNSSYLISYATHIGFDPTLLPQTYHDTPAPYRNFPLLVPKEGSFPTGLVGAVPEDFIAVWDLFPMVERHGWPSPFKAPAAHNLGQLGWLGDKAGDWHQLYFKRIQEITRHALSSNLEGLIMPLDTVATLPIPEINLLAFGEFAYNPTADPSSFLKVKLSGLYGSSEGVRNLSQILDLLEDENGMQPQNKAQALNLARPVSDGAQGAEKVHWRGLVNSLENWKTP
ncbi:MAG TPA: hypothetical protein VMW38_22495 [Terriglobia bacterium]|nr:hypothetical protein [Terriglobia bacterium]